MPFIFFLPLKNLFFPTLVFSAVEKDRLSLAGPAPVHMLPGLSESCFKGLFQAFAEDFEFHDNLPYSSEARPDNRQIGALTPQTVFPFNTSSAVGDALWNE